MVVLNKYMEAAVELGRNPVSKHRIQREYGDEQADAGRDCRTRLARPNSQAPTPTSSRIRNLTRLIHALCVTIHGKIIRVQAMFLDTDYRSIVLCGE